MMRSPMSKLLATNLVLPATPPVMPAMEINSRRGGIDPWDVEDGAGTVVSLLLTVWPCESAVGFLTLHHGYWDIYGQTEDVGDRGLDRRSCVTIGESEPTANASCQAAWTRR
jgi:hypothetical protein